MTNDHKIRKNKVLYCITKSNYGGAQRYVFDLATGLSKEKFEAGVVLGGGGILKQKLDSAGIKTISLPYLERDIHFFLELKVFWDLLRIFRKEKPDIIHLNSSKIGGLGALAGRVSRVKKIVFTVHGWAFHEERNFLSRTFIWLASWATALLSHTTIVVSRNDMISAEKFPFISNKVVLIHNGVAPFPLLTREKAREQLLGENTEAHKNDFWMGTIAELHPNKNLHVAIQAVQECNRSAHQKIFYSIIGSGELKEKLRDLAEKDSQINFAGFREDAPSLLTAFNLFLLPSKKEGLPYVLLEAGFAGIPSLVTPVGGMRDVVTGENDGFVTKGLGKEDLLASLQEIFKKREGLGHYGENLSRKIKADFTKEGMVEAVLEVYK